jgi:mercuric ion binding protein
MKALIACKTALVLAMSASLAFAGERTVTLSIDGLVCPICARNVKSALERVAGVTNVQVSVKDKIAVVVYDDASVDVNALTGATARSGFRSTPVR